jgi:hypothetical protein
MPTGTLKCVVFVLLVLTFCSVASAGDCPISTVGDWGIGEIDGKLMLYLGPHHCLVTPIPSPPQSPRCDVVYSTKPLVLGSITAGALMSRRHILETFDMLAV